MAYRITIEQNFFRAELVDRETVEEMKDFLRAVARHSTRHSSVLIQVRSSKPIFQVEHYGLIDSFREIARSPSHRIALLADALDLQASHEYIELIAKQRGLNVRSFASEAEALEWFKEQPRAPESLQLNKQHRGEEEERRQLDRRQLQGRRQREDRRQLQEAQRQRPHRSTSGS
jgi:hypothetical protein